MGSPLSVIVPAYNEAGTIREILERVLADRLRAIVHEVIVVDDGSEDDTGSRAETVAAAHPDRAVRVVRLPANRGKGAALREGLRHATGDLILVQDADLEYDPRDYPALVAPFADPGVQIVYGSRTRGLRRFGGRPSSRRYYWGGQLVTQATNLLYGSRLTDEPTGYKCFRRSVLASLSPRAEGFDVCPELTARALRRGHRIVEVPIHYAPRSFAAGKKIRWTDGVRAVWVLLRERARPLEMK